MNDIKLKGKLSRRWIYNEKEAIETIGNAEILLTPPTPEEISKLKEGDEILIKIKFEGKHNEEYLKKRWYPLETFFSRTDIVAILPSQPKQEEKKIKELAKDEPIDSSDIWVALGQVIRKQSEIIQALNKIMEGK